MARRAQADEIGQVVDLQDELAAQKAENDAQMSAKELEVQALLRRVAEMEKAHAAEVGPRPASSAQSS